MSKKGQNANKKAKNGKFMGATFVRNSIIEFSVNRTLHVLS